ncbi:MAG TPA: WS/DGAT domain-containing protein, partial [Solirubrobacterales bacterium]|nr:WS/DGAT domain-containing protein [Solirubrobacterales bacterium]
GIAGTDLFTAILDHEAETPTSGAGTWQPGPQPSGLHLAVDAMWRLLLIPYAELRAVGRASAAPGWALTRLRDLVEGALSYARRIPPTEPNSLVGNIGPHRRWTWANADLDDMKTIRQAFGGTVNDVILAAISNGFRELLLSRGEDLDGRTVRSMVPVSVRGPEGEGVPDNRVSAMWAELPVGIDDPVEQLRSISAQLEGLKESRQALGGRVLTSMGDFAPPMLLALGTRLAARTPQRAVNTVTTNVPGPQIPLYCWGRRMLAAYPYVPLAGSVRVGVAIFSYDGGIYVGVTGDYDSAPDVGVLCEGVETGLHRLLAAAGGGSRAASQTAKTTT